MMITDCQEDFQQSSDLLGLINMLTLDSKRDLVRGLQQPLRKDRTYHK